MMKRFCKITAVLLALAGAVLFALAYREHKPFLEMRIMQEALQEGAVTEAEDPFDRKIDFDALKDINPDIIGWLTYHRSKWISRSFREWIMKRI